MRVSATGTVTDVAPGAESVRRALWLPAVRAAVFTVKVVEPFPVPEAVDNVSQVALSLAVQLKVPPPVLLIVRA